MLKRENENENENERIKKNPICNMFFSLMLDIKEENTLRYENDHKTNVN